jgi:hypothetical protein
MSKATSGSPRVSPASIPTLTTNAPGSCRPPTDTRCSPGDERRLVRELAHDVSILGLGEVISPPSALDIVHYRSSNASRAGTGRAAATSRSATMPSDFVRKLPRRSGRPSARHRRLAPGPPLPSGRPSSGHRDRSRQLGAPKLIRTRMAAARHRAVNSTSYSLPVIHADPRLRWSREDSSF